MEMEMKLMKEPKSRGRKGGRTGQQQAKTANSQNVL